MYQKVMIFENLKPFCAYNVHMRALIAFSLHARTLNKLH